MVLLSPMLLCVLLLMSAAEPQRKETNEERTIPTKNFVVGTGPAKNDVVGTGPAKNDVVGIGSAKNYVVGTGPAKNDVVGTGPAKNDVDGTGPAKNDVVGTGPAKNDVVGTGPAKNDVADTGAVKNDVVGTRAAKNDVVGTGPAKDDVDGTGPAKNDGVGTGPAKNDVVGTGPAKNDVVGTGAVKNDVVGTRAAKNDVVGTRSAKNDVVGTGPAKNGVLAFSAELSKITELAPQSTIEFDQVLTNVGGMYANRTGQFACFDDGLYVFVWNLMMSNNTYLYDMRCIGSLRRGGVDRKYGPKTSYIGTSTSGVSEMMAIQECSSSNPTAVTIAVQPWSGSYNSIFYQRATSFSGFKLQTSVAFTAYLSENQVLGPGDRIIFDKIIANYGDSYDESNGNFRCNDAGVYLFSVSTNSLKVDFRDTWAVSRLMMDNIRVMLGPITYADTWASDSGSASSTTILQCTPGSSVFVESQLTYLQPSNVYGAELTSFTGFKLYDVTTESVAFTAVMSHNFTSTSAFEPVPFDEVITNIGNAFDTTVSRFVCPDDAYYLFTWTAVVDFHYGYMDLYMDDSLVKELHTTYSSGPHAVHGTSGSCTQSVILQCQPGSELQLRGKNGDSPGSFIGDYTSFSGYKIPG